MMGHRPDAVPPALGQCRWSRPKVTHLTRRSRLPPPASLWPADPRMAVSGLISGENASAELTEVRDGRSPFKVPK
jgi:hypothetical protein